MQSREEGAVSSNEYHKCMSEVYYTRALMWIMCVGIVFKLQPSEFGIILSAMCGIQSAIHLYRSYREYVEANDG